MCRPGSYVIPSSNFPVCSCRGVCLAISRPWLQHHHRRSHPPWLAGRRKSDGVPPSPSRKRRYTKGRDACGNRVKLPECDVAGSEPCRGVFYSSLLHLCCFFSSSFSSRVSPLLFFYGRGGVWRGNFSSFYRGSVFFFISKSFEILFFFFLNVKLQLLIGFLSTRRVKNHQNYSFRKKQFKSQGGYVKKFLKKGKKMPAKRHCNNGSGTRTPQESQLAGSSGA